jgi:hypothetical protein
MERDLVREADEARLRSQLEARFEVGGAAEAASRALIYVSQPAGGYDERGFTMLKQMRTAQPPASRRPVGKLKEMLKEQFLLMRLDEERAIAAIPKLLPSSAQHRQAALDALHGVVEASGGMAEEGKRRLARVDAMFNGASPSSSNEAANA